MSVLFLAEINDGQLAEDASAKAFSAARSLGDVTLLCIGADVSSAAEQASKLEGASKVLYCNDDDLDMIWQSQRQTSLPLASSYTHIVAPATASAKNILPRVAGLLDVMIIPDVMDIGGADVFDRPTYAGNAIQTVKSSDAIKVLTVRTSNFSPAVFSDGGCAVEEITFDNDNSLSAWVKNKIEANDRPELTSAGVVVSGGRGVGSEDDFKLIENLADKLGGAVGASVQLLMQAMHPTIGKSVKPVRLLRPNFMWLWASQAPFSIWPA